MCIRDRPAPAVMGRPKTAQPMMRVVPRVSSADLRPLSFRTVRPSRKRMMGTAAVSYTHLIYLRNYRAER